MSLWFLPLAKALAHEEPDAVSADFLDLFRAYAVLQSILDEKGIKDGKAAVWVDKNLESHIHYRTADGWTFIVFDDCGEWDYIDDVITPDGQSLCAKFGWDYFEQHGTIYAPTDTDLATIWKWDAALGEVE